MARIVHLSSAHPRFDSRIFGKQCRTLARAGHEVSLVVADGRGDAEHEGVWIRDAGAAGGRWDRMRRATQEVARRALALDGALYHLHDPELLPVALQLRRAGRTVIFDAHEDLPLQLLGKPYLGPVTRRVGARAAAVAERYIARRLSGVVAATPIIRDKFLTVQPRTIDVNNFPDPEEFTRDTPWPDKPPQVCYAGSISSIRGAREMLRACDYLRSAATLVLAGPLSEAPLAAQLVSPRLRTLGVLDQAGVARLLGQSRAGLVTLHPYQHFQEAQPIKLFEYMAAGIPVIASDFPRWRSLVEGHQCGLLVDPRDPRAIAAAIDYLVEHPAVARRMGENGRAAVCQHYAWDGEARKLLDFYSTLLEEAPCWHA
ncbi:glycosyltransferase family 4 protein [Massilia sp. TS11]|uniref:glycosyltransferase family 4 protein n=1 Tax=Massilia sp. TS11 TaxID=2908003 RepID=UPI001EDA66E0|nr:glycosyltransferase family 4 protein [Massilia sp. TS11]MCG2584304.1 glycosyltransferase family 4 protein [Massilia sp. TS11]